MSRQRWLVYLALLCLASVVGLPLTALLESYNVTSEPQALGDWGVWAGFHLGFVVFWALVLLAWWKLLRAHSRAGSSSGNRGGGKRRCRGKVARGVVRRRAADERGA